MRRLFRRWFVEPFEDWLRDLLTDIVGDATNGHVHWLDERMTERFRRITPVPADVDRYGGFVSSIVAALRANDKIGDLVFEHLLADRTRTREQRDALAVRIRVRSS